MRRSRYSPAIAVLSLMSLAAVGAFGAHLGGAPLGRAALRATVGGALAMAIGAAIGHTLGIPLLKGISAAFMTGRGVLTLKSVDGDEEAPIAGRGR